MSANRILVFNYHLITREIVQHPPPLERRFSIPEEEFIKQMNLIRELEIPVVPIDQVSNSAFPHEFAVSLTFDDGNISDYTLVFPFLKSLGFPAAFFPVVSTINSQGRVTWNQLKKLAANKFIIGSHGFSHSSLIHLSTHQKKHEIQYSKAFLEEKLRIPVEYFAAPFGLIDPEVLRFAKDAGYISVLSTHLKMNRPHFRPDVIYRMNIKENTSLQTLKSLLINRGKLSFKNTLFPIFLESGKQILGPRLTHSLSSLLYN